MALPQRNIVLNSILCFAFNNLNKHSSKLVKSVISDFYKLETIANAKDRLTCDIEKANLSIKLPPKRRVSKNMKLTI